MEQPADFQLLEADGALRAQLTGDWTSRMLGGAAERLRTAIADRSPKVVDLTRIGRCDTSGAFAIVRAADIVKSKRRLEARPETERLMELVSKASETADAPPPPRVSAWTHFLERLGRGLVNLALEGFDTLAFTGRILTATGRLIANPKRFRWAPFVALAERAGLDALPIVAVTSFFIGAVIGLLGAHMLSQFGAQVFAVELIGIAVLREFCIIITAVLLAGRSASSFAAEIGSMKMNQEIDAMQVMGVDPFDALVLPRFMALLITIPLLTFIAAVAGLAGGLVVTWAVLGISPDFFVQRIADFVGVSHFWVGLSKAPVMAIVIAGIGCRQGMEVGGDVKSLGRRVTAAVVHAIFSIIMIDAVFALLYMELNVERRVRPGPDVHAQHEDEPPPIEVKGLVSAFGDQVIHDGLDLTVNAGEVLGVVGGSGAGKSVLLNTIIGLKAPDGGTIKVFGRDINRSNDDQMSKIEQRWGVLFQNGALFSNLTVRENVAAPFFEHTDMPRKDVYELADLKIALTGLPPHAGDLKPAELSGGMRKRAALARALALDPDLLFLDEPTSGLDPISAGAFDELIRDLSESLGLTVFMITHDLDSLYAICDRVAVIADKKVVASGTIPELKKSPHPWIQEYFNGPRGRAAAQSEDGAHAEDAIDAAKKAEALSQDPADKTLVKDPATKGPAQDHPKGAA